MTGIERRRASSTSDWVVGPKSKRPTARLRSARRRSSSNEPPSSQMRSSRSMPRSSSGSSESTSSSATRPAMRPNTFIGIAEHDVVDARLALNRAGLAASGARAGHALKLERDVLRHVPDPCALAHAFDEASAAPEAAAVPLQAGQQLDQPVGEARDVARRVILDPAEIGMMRIKGVWL
jgi:hypothetical protein